MSSDKSEDFPQEMVRPIRDLHESLADLKQCLTTFNSKYTAIKSQASDPLMKAKIELTIAYAMNSLFWIYLTTKGVNPHEEPIKNEITRLKGYAQRIQDIEDKRKASKLDTEAAKRFIKSALWEPKTESIINETNKDNICHKRKLEDQSYSETKETNDISSKEMSTNQKSRKKFKK